MIYFLRHIETGLIKIGCTVDLTTRVYAITHKYGDVELLGLATGHYEDETELHNRFHLINVRNVLEGREWFRDCKELRDFIAKYTKLTIPLPFPEFTPLRISNSMPPIPSGLVGNSTLYIGVGMLLHKKFDGNVPTIAEISRQTGIHFQGVKKWIYGDIQKISWDHIKKWCDYFDCNQDDLIVTIFPKSSSSYEDTKHKISLIDDVYGSFAA